jgi:SAM-dependent methyltransferase
MALADEARGPLVSTSDFPDPSLREINLWIKLRDAGPAYASADYWNDRYTSRPDAFEWYHPWADLAPLVGPFCDPSQTVLHIGCGTSPMSVELGGAFALVVNIDISPVAIHAMQERFPDLPNVEWMAMDCTNMRFLDESFDAVFDKGTVDALLCSEIGCCLVEDTVAEVHRVLKPGGYFFEASSGAPESRIRTCCPDGVRWRVLEPTRVTNSEDGTEHWLYVFRKEADAQPPPKESGHAPVDREPPPTREPLDRERKAAADGNVGEKGDRFDV